MCQDPDRDLGWIWIKYSWHAYAVYFGLLWSSSFSLSRLRPIKFYETETNQVLSRSLVGAGKGQISSPAESNTKPLKTKKHDMMYLMYLPMKQPGVAACILPRQMSIGAMHLCRYKQIFVDRKNLERCTSHLALGANTMDLLPRFNRHLTFWISACNQLQALQNDPYNNL